QCESLSVMASSNTASLSYREVRMHLPVFCRNWACRCHSVATWLTISLVILGGLAVARSFRGLGQHSRSFGFASRDCHCPSALKIQFSEATEGSPSGARFGSMGYELDLLYLAALLLLVFQGPVPCCSRTPGCNVRS